MLVDVTLYFVNWTVAIHSVTVLEFKSVRYFSGKINPGHCGGILFSE